MRLIFDPLAVVLFVVALVPAVVLHEVSHGWLAERLGDPTPRRMGRLTLKPGPHVDRFGTLVVPGLLLLPVLFGRGGAPFAYANPMPIDRSFFRNPDRAQIWIALVGIGTNLVLAVAGAVPLRFVGSAGLVGRFLVTWVFTNVLIAVFNIIPVPPLDGSKVLATFLPTRARQVYESWEPYGALFVLVILFLIPAPILGIVGAVTQGLLDLLIAR